MCGCRENTACSNQGFVFKNHFDWTGIEEYKGKKLCCVCGPRYYSDGRTPVRLGFSDREKPVGVWHDRFARVFLPKGEFITNRVGNLEHKSDPSITIDDVGMLVEYEPISVKRPIAKELLPKKIEIEAKIEIPKHIKANAYRFYYLKHKGRLPRCMRDTKTI